MYFFSFYSFVQTSSRGHVFDRRERKSLRHFESTHVTILRRKFWIFAVDEDRPLSELASSSELDGYKRKEKRAF